jgi:hypothetical protein
MEITDKYSFESEINKIKSIFEIIQSRFNKGGGEEVVAFRRLSGKYLDIIPLKLKGQSPQKLYNEKRIKMGYGKDFDGKPQTIKPEAPITIVRKHNFKFVNMEFFEELGDLMPFLKKTFDPLINYKFSNKFDTNPFEEIIQKQPIDSDFKNAAIVIKDQELMVKILSDFSQNSRGTQGEDIKPKRGRPRKDEGQKYPIETFQYNKIPEDWVEKDACEIWPLIKPKDRTGHIFRRLIESGWYKDYARQIIGEDSKPIRGKIAVTRSWYHEKTKGQ